MVKQVLLLKSKGNIALKNKRYAMGTEAWEVSEMMGNSARTPTNPYCELSPLSGHTELAQTRFVCLLDSVSQKREIVCFSNYTLEFTEELFEKYQFPGPLPEIFIG